MSEEEKRASKASASSGWDDNDEDSLDLLSSAANADGETAETT